MAGGVLPIPGTLPVTQGYWQALLQTFPASAVKASLRPVVAAEASGLEPEPIPDHADQAFGDLLGLLVAGRFDHHPDQWFGA